jgi:flagellar basal-body rod protein FlgC
MFDALDIGATGLTAQRVRMNTIANNVLNINTIENAQGQNIPFRRRLVTFQPGSPEDPSKPGVRVGSIEQDKSPFRKVFEPGSKHADAEGYVKYPNVNLETEFVNMLEASRAYEANVTMMETTKAMISASLRLLA